MILKQNPPSSLATGISLRKVKLIVSIHTAPFGSEVPGTDQILQHQLKTPGTTGVLSCLSIGKQPVPGVWDSFMTIQTKSLRRINAGIDNLNY